MSKHTLATGHMKIYKIAYEVNLMPLLGMYMKIVPGDDQWHTKTEIINRDVQLMDLISDSTDIGIFKARQVLEVIDFKWDRYGANHHIVGFSNHVLYVFALCLYI